MTKKSLNEYIKGLLQKGYDISAVRNVLLKYGYTNEEINESINSIYHPTIRHEIHLSRATTYVLLFVVLAILAVASFLYFSPPKTAAKLLDLNLEPIKTSAEPEENIIFLKELSNLGSTRRYDVVIKQEIIEPVTNKAITQKIETRAIETFGSTQTKILVPKDAGAGDYILRVIVEYDSKKAVATLPIKILAAGKKEEIPTEEESEMDVVCDDNNPCSDDKIENGVCISKPISPCCGNNICETHEEGCAADCQQENPTPDLSSTELSQERKELAKSDPSKALQQCRQIEVPGLKDACIGEIGEAQLNKNYCSQIIDLRIKDLCYSNIAKSANDNSLCQEISIDSRKDSCYMTFVLDNKDYSVCDKISNKHLSQSCESLKQLNELNKQQSQSVS
ncbi:MAG: hypothetical protein AABX33_02770 [Nanoarchaeota archaeon]